MFAGTRTLAGPICRAVFVACVLTVLCALAPTSSSAAQVTLAWDPNTEPDLAGYKLYYGTSSRSYQLGGDLGNRTSYTLAGLLEGQIYYFAATAYNSSLNESGFSNEVSTTIDTTPPVISLVSAFNISASQATITWATNKASDSQVDYGPTTVYGSSMPLNSSLLTAHAVTLAGLLATTTYHYRVKSRDAAGNLATSGDFTLTTLAAPVAASLTVNGTSTGITVMGGTTVSVGVQNGPGTASDCVGLYSTSAALFDPALSLAFVNGSAATLPFVMPTTPGPYEFRFFQNCANARKLATSPTVTVQ